MEAAVGQRGARRAVRTRVTEVARPASRSSTAAPPRAKTGVGTSSTCDGPRSFRRFVTGPRTGTAAAGTAAAPLAGNGRSCRRCSARPGRCRAASPGGSGRAPQAHSHRHRRAARRAPARSRRSCASRSAGRCRRSRSRRASRRSRPTLPQARAARRRRRCTGRAMVASISSHEGCSERRGRPHLFLLHRERYRDPLRDGTAIGKCFVKIHGATGSPERGIGAHPFGLERIRMADGGDCAHRDPREGPCTNVVSRRCPTILAR